MSTVKRAKGMAYAMVDPGGGKVQFVSLLIGCPGWRAAGHDPPRLDLLQAEVVLVSAGKKKPSSKHTPQHNNGPDDNRLESLSWYNDQQQAEDAAR